ncbi:flagellar basal body rod protein FlgB [Paenibacillus sp. GYB006]|uniref:flagellar basal body rod protein FlgB n=1 Tax=unclassified Paenibacillus TaxID=185978 RepID=UPI001BCCCA9F|nr:flagellar basal body rod protein FlgB [Paenibacillus sp. J45TS6]
MNLLNDSSFKTLQAGIDAANLRQRAIANNIANSDTPYFKRSEVKFEEFLQDEMKGNVSTLSGKTTNEKHIPIGLSSKIPAARISTDHNTVMNNNENNVDVDKEMTLLAENQLRYNAYIQQVTEQIKMMRIATGGSS